MIEKNKNKRRKPLKTKPEKLMKKIKIIKPENQNKKKVNVKKIKTKSKKVKKLDLKILLNYKKEIFICFIIALIFFFVFILFNYHQFGLVIKKNIGLEDTTIIYTESSDNYILEYKTEILVFSSGKLYTYDKNGKKTWERQLELSYTPIINSEGNYIQVVNKEQGYVYIFKNKYETARIKIDGNIKSSKIDKDGTSVIEYTQQGTKTNIDIYNSLGKEMYNMTLSTKTILDYVYLNNKKFIYLDVNIDGMSLKTELKLIDLTDSLDNEPKVILSKENEIAYKMNVSKDIVYVLFEDEVLKYNVNNEKQTIYKNPSLNVLNMEIDTSQYIYIAQNKQTGEYELAKLKFGKEKERSITFQEAPKSFIHLYNMDYVIYSKDIKIYNYLGMNVKNYSSENLINKPVIFNSGKSLAINISNKIILFTI